jgi:tetratricopeptide (TPR) repeat protein
MSMRSIIRTTRDLMRVARSGDPHALDRAVKANPHAVARTFHTPGELLCLGLAWRDRARLITDDVADLDKAVETLERIAADVPLARAELALTLWLRHTFTGRRADADGAVEAARDAVAAAPDQARPREILAHIEERLPAPVDQVTRSDQVTGTDGRVAVVWTGMYAGAERLLVTIDAAEDLDTDTFAEIWDGCPWDVTVLLRVGDQLLPYRMTDDLAADALVSVATPVTVRGPYRVPGPAVCSFVLSGHVAGRTRRVAVVTPDDEPVADDLARRLLHVELCTGEPGLDTLTTAEFGEAMLRSATHHEHAGLTCVWLRPTDNGYSYGVRRDEDEPLTTMLSLSEDWPPPDDRLEAEAATWDQLRAFHAETYRRDVHQLMSGEHTDDALVTAFEKFTLHLRFTDPESKTAIDTVHDGLALVDALTDRQFVDAAERVATSCADVAARQGMPEEQRALLRHAAIACGVAGRLADALRHYQAALDVEGPCAHRWLGRSLHIGYATTCVRVFAAHELDDAPVDAELARNALAHLDIGEELALAAPIEETAWERMAIPAHRWRLRDLLGEHERAAAELDRLVRDPAMAELGSLRSNAVLFHLAALRKLDDARFGDVLRAAAKGPGSVVLNTFLADRLIEQGDHVAAFRAAEEAHELQAGPGLPGSVDTLARMCRAWWLLERSGEDSKRLFPVLRQRVETAKTLTRDATVPVRPLSHDAEIPVLPAGTALVTFYEAREFTLVSCTTPDRDVHLSLAGGLSETALAEAFTPMIPVLRDCPRILVSPHGTWHKVPVHALILPRLWDSGRSPALSYLPSLAPAGDPPVRAAIAAYPSAPSGVADVLRSSMSTVDVLAGKDVTPAEVLSMAERSEVLHVLADGTDAGLALSPGSGSSGLLTTSDLSRARFSGTHVTLERCSAERVATSALLAGADSVLAPMWDVDPHASTRLLTGFYESWLVAGKSKAQALTDAQRDLYRDAEVHWAAFKLMGA